MTHIEDVLHWAVAQKGDRYVFGAEVSPSADDSAEWDCSELVEWSCAKAGVQPTVLDGAYNQWMQAKKAGTLVSVAEGISTRGALLFAGDGVGVGRDAITHVAFSLGDGNTIEARGKKWGVGCWAAANRFSFAARLPGVDYGPGGAAQPAAAAATVAGASAEVPPFPGTVQRGSKGDAVRQVQQRLHDRGWTIGVDGDFGPQTDRQVRAFQQEKGLAVDGIVGPNTWEALWQAPVT